MTPKPQSTKPGRTTGTSGCDRPVYKDTSAWIIGITGLLGIIGLLYAASLYSG